MKRATTAALGYVFVISVLATCILLLGGCVRFGSKAADSDVHSSDEQAGKSSYSYRTEKGAKMVSCDDVPAEVIGSLEKCIADKGYDLSGICFYVLDGQYYDPLKMEYLYPYDHDIKVLNADHYIEVAFDIEPSEAEWENIYIGYVGLFSDGTVVEDTVIEQSKMIEADITPKYSLNELREMALPYSKDTARNTILVGHGEPYLYEDETGIKLLYNVVLSDNYRTAVIMDNVTGTCIETYDLHLFDESLEN